MNAPLAEFPQRYSYKAVQQFPHHIMSLERGKLFFVNCYRTEDEAIARLHLPWGEVAPERLAFHVQGTARYRDGNLIEVVAPEVAA